MGFGSLPRHDERRLTRRHSPYQTPRRTRVRPRAALLALRILRRGLPEAGASAASVWRARNRRELSDRRLLGTASSFRTKSVQSMVPIPNDALAVERSAPFAIDRRGHLERSAGRPPRPPAGSVSSSTRRSAQLAWSPRPRRRPLNCQAGARDVADRILGRNALSAITAATPGPNPRPSTQP